MPSPDEKPVETLATRPAPESGTAGTRPSSPLSPRTALTAAVIVVAAIYLAGAFIIGQAHSIWSPDCGARLIQVQSVLRHWPRWWISYPGQPLDPQHQNSPLYFYEFAHGGRIYVFYSFLYALISALCFRLFGYTGLALLPLLSGIGSAAAVYGIARLLRFRFPLAPFFLCALATPIAVYSVVFWDHSITTFIAAGSLYLAIWAVVTNRPIGWFAAGLALGGGLWIHEILIPYLPALAVGAWWMRRRQPWLINLGLLAAGAVVIVAPLLIVNQSCYGTPLGPHLSNNRLGSGHAFLDWFLQWDLWFPGALYTLFAWGSANPGFTWQFYDWLQAPWPTVHHAVNVAGAAVPIWVLLAAPLATWTALATSGTLRRLWAVPLGLGVTYLAAFAFVYGHTDWPELPAEILISMGLALPVLLWIALAVTDRWRSLWSASAALLGVMFLDCIFIILHQDWPHSLFYACPFLALAFGCFGKKRPGAAAGPSDGDRSGPRGRRSARSHDKRDLKGAGPSPRGETGSETGVLMSGIGVITAVYTLAALFNPALGGAEWGSRYLLITVPALTLFAWAAVERLIPAPGPDRSPAAWQPGAKPLLAGVSLLVVMSVALQLRGFQIVSNMHRENRKLADAIEQTPDPVVVTTVWWAPLDAAPAYYSKIIFYAGDPGHPAPPLFQRMRQAGIRTFTCVGATNTDLSAFARDAGYFPISYGTAFKLGIVRYPTP